MFDCQGLAARAQLEVLSAKSFAFVNVGVFRHYEPCSVAACFFDFFGSTAVSVAAGAADLLFFGRRLPKVPRQIFPRRDR
jgi:hypothetical protein